MAWLECKETLFRHSFPLRREKQFVALKTAKEREANSCLARFEENLWLAERGEDAPGLRRHPLDGDQ
jgi:hypothetical protein